MKKDKATKSSTPTSKPKKLSPEVWLELLVKEHFPPEDTLVACDWCEEHDRPFAAEFLRYVLARNRRVGRLFEPHYEVSSRGRPEFWWWWGNYETEDYDTFSEKATGFTNLLPKRLFQRICPHKPAYEDWPSSARFPTKLAAWLALLRAWEWMRAAGENPVSPSEHDSHEERQ